jgi:predicted aspartyl protease
MGLTHVGIEIANPAVPERRVRLRMLVDSGAAYSVVDAATLRDLGIVPNGERTFILADGTEITRRIGVATFSFRGQQGGSTVIFGESGDALILGVVTLEELGLILDPMRREIRPMPLTLMPLRPIASAALG